MPTIREIRAIAALGAGLDVEPAHTRRTFVFDGRRVSLMLRPLTFFEIQRLMIRTQRRVGWLNNPALLAFLVRRATAPRDRRRIQRDRNPYLTSRVAREIWLLTLRYLARVVRRIARDLDLKLEVPTPRPYLPSHLATPGMLHLLAEDSALRDESRALVNLWLSKLVAGAQLNGRDLTGDELLAEVQARRTSILIRVLQEASGERTTIEALPESLFPSFEARAIGYERLINTLDWVQFARVVRAFNIVADVLAYRCNQLGGLIVGVNEPRLNTGAPAFLSFLEPQGIPGEVLSAVLLDLLRGGAPDVPTVDRARFRRAASQTIKAVRRRLGRDEEDNTLINRTFFEEFSKRVPHADAVVRRLCLAYWERFDEHVQRGREAAARHYQEHEDDFIRVASGRVLVEGEADELVMRACLWVRQPQARIRIVSCDGKARVVARYRETIEQDAFTGAVVTIVDEDASREHEDLKRIDPGRATVWHWRHEDGALEDQIPVDLHLAALERWASPGEPITADMLPEGQSMESSLGRVLWERRRTSFDKVAHADAVARVIIERQSIPEALEHLVAKIAELSEEVERRSSRPATAIGVDAELRRNAFRAALARAPG